jgi:multidrug resistance efflux pump
LEQAERSLAEAQEKYDNAWDEARDWELNYNEPVCHPGQGGSIPCTGITWRQRIENDREGTTRGLQGAQDNLTLARANYNLAQAGLNSNSALNAETGVVSAQQALDQATRGPKAEEIEAAQLRVEQAEISLEQSQLILTQADNALADTELIAPWSGTVLSVETAPGALVGGGSPIVRLLDLTQLEFHTTNLSERDLAQIAPGQTAVITLKAYPNDPLAGTVQRIDLQAGKMVGDAATFPVIIVLDAVALDIRPGMTGRTEISRGE